MRRRTLLAAVGLATSLARASLAEEEPSTAPPPSEPAQAPAANATDTSPPVEPPTKPATQPASSAASGDRIGEPFVLPSMSGKFADRWHGETYAGTSVWVSSDAALCVLVTEGDPAITDTQRGSGSGGRARVLIHVDRSFALGARLAFDRAAIPGGAGGEWNTLEIAQTSFAATLRWAPLVFESLEVAAAAHTGGSVDSFSTTRRNPSAPLDWVGTSLVAGGGIEVSFFPSSVYRQIELQLFSEAEIHTAGAKTQRPAYQDGGLPRSERATLRAGAGLGYHF